MSGSCRAAHASESHLHIAVPLLTSQQIHGAYHYLIVPLMTRLILAFETVSLFGKLKICIQTVLAATSGQLKGPQIVGLSGLKYPLASHWFTAPEHHPRGGVQQNRFTALPQMEAAVGGILQVRAWLSRQLGVPEHDDLSHLSSTILIF